jgi:hypothetical protein
LSLWNFTANLLKKSLLPWHLPIPWTAAQPCYHPKSKLGFCHLGWHSRGLSREESRIHEGSMKAVHEA